MKMESSSTWDHLTRSTWISLLYQTAVLALTAFHDSEMSREMMIWRARSTWLICVCSRLAETQHRWTVITFGVLTERRKGGRSFLSAALSLFSFIISKGTLLACLKLDICIANVSAGGQKNKVRRVLCKIRKWNGVKSWWGFCTYRLKCCIL